ncbi:F-box protein isoform X2 [Spatholobus suberectus]|nr:F-box protein isoform X2 [Spatholobus suberectus]
MTITVDFMSGRFFSLIFSCQTLTSLELFNTSFLFTAELPKSLQLLALKSLRLKNVRYAASDNDCVEPFSTCGSLNTLVIEDFFDPKVLCVSNSNLRSMTLRNFNLFTSHKIVLSTPNLRSLTVTHAPFHQLSACDLSFLEQVNIDFQPHCVEYGLSVISLPRELAHYVKILTLSSGTLEILNGLSPSDSIMTQIPCFLQLKSLKLKSSPNISDEEVRRIVEYLLQYTLGATKVDVINC